MRKSLAILAVVLCAALVGGCKKKDKDNKKKPAPTKSTPSTKADPTKTDPKAPTAPTMVNKMANCPNAVKDAETKVSVTKAAVVVTVTAKDAAAVAEIRKRAEHLASVQSASSDKVAHTGKGTGGAQLGKCPIMLDAVKLEIKEIEGGVEASMTPNDASKMASLEHNARSRARGIGRAGMGGHKHGSGMGGGGSKGAGGDGEGSGNSKGDDTKKKLK